MNPCHCAAIEGHFGPAVAERDAAAYRRGGPDPTTRLILQAVREAGLRDFSLLDVGGGIGVLCHELLRDGATGATLVEAAPAYAAAARAEAERLGHENRMGFVAADLVDVAPTLPAADVVLLDRVVCCDPEYEPLLARSAEKALHCCALSYPRDRWYVRLGVAAENALRRLSRNTFRTFVHPAAAVERVFLERGFVLRSRRETLLWRIDLYARTI